jgi:isoamylase
LVLFNAHYEAIAFTLPEVAWGTEWTKLLDTAQGGWIEDEHPVLANTQIVVEGRALALLVQME